MANTSSLLQKVIKEQGLSRNNLIHTIDIDRSSFYQILNGKRPGTIDQFARILSQLDLSPELTWQLMREYASRKFGQDYTLYEIVDRWMRRLSTADCDNAYTFGKDEDHLRDEESTHPIDINLSEESANKKVFGSSTLVRLLRQLIVSKTDQEKPVEEPLYLYIPLRLFTKIWMQTDIPELLNAIPDPQGIRILVRIDLEEQGTIDGQLELLFSFLFGLYHIRDFTKLVHCIYSDRSEMNTPFPYFAVDKERVYLMNRSCDKAVSVQQRDVADAYASFFIALACQHYAYLEEHASLEDFMGAIHRRFIDNSGDDKINRMVERRLCIFKVVNDDLINRYADESIRELLQSYLSMFQRMQSVFLNSASALQEFRKDHSVMENGIEITIDPEDAEKLCQYAGTSEVKDILLLFDQNPR